MSPHNMRPEHAPRRCANNNKHTARRNTTPTLLGGGRCDKRTAPTATTWLESTRLEPGLAEANQDKASAAPTPTKRSRICYASAHPALHTQACATMLPTIEGRPLAPRWTPALDGCAAKMASIPPLTRGFGTMGGDIGPTGDPPERYAWRPHAKSGNASDRDPIYNTLPTDAWRQGGEMAT